MLTYFQCTYGYSGHFVINDTNILLSSILNGFPETGTRSTISLKKFANIENGNTL